MRTIRYIGRLGNEFLAYAWQNKTWWLIPLVIVLGLFALLIGVTQVALPFLYPAF